MGIAEAASRGHAKMLGKADQMKRGWDAAKSRMKSNYGAFGFGPTRVANYSAGIDRGVFRVDADKWKRNWETKMAE